MSQVTGFFVELSHFVECIQHVMVSWLCPIDQNGTVFYFIESALILTTTKMFALLAWLCDSRGGTFSSRHKHGVSQC